MDETLLLGGTSALGLSQPSINKNLHSTVLRTLKSILILL